MILLDVQKMAVRTVFLLMSHLIYLILCLFISFSSVSLFDDFHFFPQKSVLFLGSSVLGWSAGGVDGGLLSRLSELLAKSVTAAQQVLRAQKPWLGKIPTFSEELFGVSNCVFFWKLGTLS